MAAKKKSVKKATKKTSSKKSSSKKSEAKKVFYVGVTDPLEKQREILKITADYLRMLKNIEEVRQTRDKKKKVLGEFHKLMKDIRSDAATLYGLLPKYDLPKKVSPVVEKISEPKVVQQVVQKVAVHSEIDALEAELAAIEGKLGSMN